MFFHRAIGKITFPLIAIAFMAISVQTTWQFLSEALPHENLLYRILGLAVFELGAFCWFSLLTAGAENVLRTLIALVMTCICVGGVATAAIFELGKQMSDIGFKEDPSFMAWVPVCVLAGFVSTGIATLLYMAASPHFAHRISHMNATGQEPPIGSHIEMLPYTRVSSAPALTAQPQPRALPAPKQQAANQAPRAQGDGLLNRVGNWFARTFNGVQNGAPQPANEQADNEGEEDANEPVEQPDGAQQKRQGSELGMIEQRMLDAFLNASPTEQDALLQMARTKSTAEVTAHLQSQYPSYAGFINESRVRNVMGAYLEQVKEAQPQMQNSAPPRPASARTKPTGTTKSKVAARRSADDLARLLAMIDQAQPGLSAAQLARMANCDESTVRRYRASKKQPAGQQ